MDDQLVAKGSLACEMEVAVALARALREQQTLLQSTDIGVAFIQKRAIQRCNQQFAEIFGFPDSASLLGQASYLLHPSRDAFRALGRDAFAEMAQGRTFRSLRQMRRKDGSLFWASLTGRFINSEAPSEGAIWTLDDVDAQNTYAFTARCYSIANPNLARSRHGGGGLCARAQGGAVQSACCSKCWGTPRAVVRPGSTRLVLPATATGLCSWPITPPTLATGKVFAAELNLRAPRWGRADLRDPQQGLGRWQHGMDFTGITERRQTQEALRQAHAELKRVVSGTHPCVGHYDQGFGQRNPRAQIRPGTHLLAGPLRPRSPGLPNRSLLAERSQQAIAQAQCSNTPLAVLFLDSTTSSTSTTPWGTKSGDSLLTHIAKRLSQTVREIRHRGPLGRR